MIGLGGDAAPPAPPPVYLCKRRGCWKPTWNSQPREFCGRKCQGESRQRDTKPLEPRKIEFAGDFSDRKAGLIAFYYPGKEEAWDRLCQSGFLGNFFDVGYDGLVMTAPCDARERYFLNAEAAFQAIKYWDHIEDFQSCSGDEAFRKSRSLIQQPDPSYAGFRSNWNAMLAVLRAKFHPKSRMADALVKTSPAFLLEHNAVSGRDAIWSNNNDGNGLNWLGLQLMLVREELAGPQKAGHWVGHIKKWIDLSTGGEKYHGGEKKWLEVVKSATDALQTCLRREAFGSGVTPHIGAKDLWICIEGVYHQGHDIEPYSAHHCTADIAKGFADDIPQCVGFTHVRGKIAWYHYAVYAGSTFKCADSQRTHCLFIHEKRFRSRYSDAALRQVMNVARQQGQRSIPTELAHQSVMRSHTTSTSVSAKNRSASRTAKLDSSGTEVALKGAGKTKRLEAAGAEELNCGQESDLGRSAKRSPPRASDVAPGGPGTLTASVDKVGEQMQNTPPLLPPQPDSTPKCGEDITQNLESKQTNQADQRTRLTESHTLAKELDDQAYVTPGVQDPTQQAAHASQEMREWVVLKVERKVDVGNKDVWQSASESLANGDMGGDMEVDSGDMEVDSDDL